MRLKEIEARLAQIRNELNTRAAELTAEEITALETEVTDLQEERTQILEQAERRNNLLARIAAGESIDDGQGGEGAAPRVLRILAVQPERATTATSTAVWNTERHLCVMYAVVQLFRQSTEQMQ